MAEADALVGKDPTQLVFANVELSMVRKVPEVDALSIELAALAASSPSLVRSS